MKRWKMVGLAKALQKASDRGWDLYRRMETRGQTLLGCRLGDDELVGNAKWGLREVDGRAGSGTVAARGMAGGRGGR